jgi:hypothetical protein
MVVLNNCDWFNVGAIVPLLVVLFSSTFGLFEAPAMSLQTEGLWILGIIIIASLVWFNAAKMQQGKREAEEREREGRVILDEIKQMLAKPRTTLEDVKVLVGDLAHFEGRVVDRESSGFRGTE